MNFAIEISQVCWEDLAHHNCRPLLQPVEVQDSSLDQENNLFKDLAEADLLDVYSVGWRVNRAFDADISGSSRSQQLDRIVLELGEDSVGAMIPLPFEILIAVAHTENIGLRLVRKVDYIGELPDPNLFFFEAGE